MELKQLLKKITGETAWLSDRQVEAKACELINSQESRIKELEETVQTQNEILTTIYKYMQDESKYRLRHTGNKAAKNI